MTDRFEHAAGTDNVLGLAGRIVSSYVSNNSVPVGELPAMLLIDALVRQMPGALNDAGSAEEDSFVDGLLDCPHYSRPETYEGSKVPDVLLSGDHARIRRWRLKQALGRTWLRRPDLLKGRALSKEESRLLVEFQRENSDDAASRS